MILKLKCMLCVLITEISSKIKFLFFLDSLDSSNEESYLHPSLLKSAKQPETVGAQVFIYYKMLTNII